MNLHVTADGFASELFEQIDGLQALEKALTPAVATRVEVAALLARIADLEEQLAAARAEATALRTRVADIDEADLAASRAHAE